MAHTRSRIYGLSLAGLFVSSIVGTLFILSIPCWYGYEGRGAEISFAKGALNVAGGDLDSRRSGPFEGWFWHPPGNFSLSGPPVVWWAMGNSAGSIVVLAIPLWIPFLGIAVPSTIAWRRARPRLLGPERVTLRVYLCFFVAYASCAYLFFFLISVVFYTTGLGHWTVFVMIGVLFLLTPLGAYVWSDIYVEHRNRRTGGNYCQTCGYNLAGNTSGVCPECGTGISD